MLDSGKLGMILLRNWRCTRLLVSRKFSRSLLVRRRGRGVMYGRGILLARLSSRQETASMLVASRVLGSFLRIRHLFEVMSGRSGSCKVKVAEVLMAG